MIILFERGRGRAVPRPVVIKGSRNVTGGVGGWGRGRLHANSVGSWLVTFYLAVLWLLLLSLRKPPGVFIYTSFNAIVPHSSAPRRGCAAAVPGGQRALQRALSWIPNAASGKRLSGEPFSLWPEPTASSSHSTAGLSSFGSAAALRTGLLPRWRLRKTPATGERQPGGGKRNCSHMRGAGRQRASPRGARKRSVGEGLRGPGRAPGHCRRRPGQGPAAAGGRGDPGASRRGGDARRHWPPPAVWYWKLCPDWRAAPRGRGGTWGRSYCLGNPRLPLRARGGGGGGSAARPSPVAAWGNVLPSSAGAAALAGGVAGDGGGRWPGRWVCAGGRARSLGRPELAVPRSEGDGTERRGTRRRAGLRGGGGASPRPPPPARFGPSPPRGAELRRKRALLGLPLVATRRLLNFSPARGKVSAAERGPAPVTDRPPRCAARPPAGLAPARGGNGRRNKWLARAACAGGTAVLVPPGPVHPPPPSPATAGPCGPPTAPGGSGRRLREAGGSPGAQRGGEGSPDRLGLCFVPGGSFPAPPPSCEVSVIAVWFASDLFGTPGCAQLSFWALFFFRTAGIRKGKQCLRSVFAVRCSFRVQAGGAVRRAMPVAVRSHRVLS